RAYMIVMIGHYSKMEYATGVDHLIYGWIFFGVVMFILFWLGSFWQEEQAPPAFVAPPRTLTLQNARSRVLIVSSLALLLSAATVLWTEQLENIEVQTAGVLEAPTIPGEWSLSDQPVLWSMAHQPTAHKIEARYERQGDEDVQLFVALFPRQGQGGEAINQQNGIATDLVRLTTLGSRDVALDESQVTIKQARVLVTVDGSRHEHLMWQWYRVAGRNLSNRYAGKAWEALSRIYPGRADGAWVAITTPIEGEKIQSAEERLASFARAMAPQLDLAVDAVLGLAN
ncbi:MAG: exosortase C-terminal domain/associated protein EpsI, partial [Sedimenticolaceae bacterium]